MDGYPNNTLSTEWAVNVLLTRFFCCRFVKRSTGQYIREFVTLNFRNFVVTFFDVKMLKTRKYFD